MSDRIDMQLRRLFERHGQGHDALRERLLAALDEEPAAGLRTDTAPRRRLTSAAPLSEAGVRRWVLRISAAAATVVIAAMLWATFLGQPSTLYAKAVEALERAGTARAIVTADAGDRQVGVAELWYDRQRGFAVVVGMPGEPQRTIIDNGERRWEYVAGQSFAIVSPSQDPQRAFIRQLSLHPAAKDWVRVPAEDVAVGDTPLEAYTPMARPSEAPAQATRVVALLDPHNRVRRLLVQEPMGNDFATRFRAEVEYGVEVEPSRFEPRFGPEVRLIDAAQLIDDRFGLEAAVHRQEAAGLIFALHEARAVEGGRLLVLASLRPTEQMLEERSRIGRPISGTFGNLLPDRDDAQHLPISLASMDHFTRPPYLRVVWLLVTPRQPLSSEAAAQAGEPVRLSLAVHQSTTREDLREGRVRPEVWERKRAQIQVELTPAGEPLTLDALARRVHQDASPLAGVAGVLLATAPEQRGGELVWESKRPAELSPEEYARELVRLVRFWEADVRSGPSMPVRSETSDKGAGSKEAGR